MCVRARDSASQHSTVQLLLHATLSQTWLAPSVRKSVTAAAETADQAGFAVRRVTRPTFLRYCTVVPAKKYSPWRKATPTLRALPTHRLLYVGLWLIVGKRVRRMSGRKLLYWQMEKIEAIYLYCLSLSCIMYLSAPNSKIYDPTAYISLSWRQTKVIGIRSFFESTDPLLVVMTVSRHCRVCIWVCICVCLCVMGVDGTTVLRSTESYHSQPYQSDTRQQDYSYFWKIPRSPRYWMEFTVDKIKWLRKSLEQISLSFFCWVELQLNSLSNEWHESESLTNVNHSLELGVKA